MGNRIGRRQLLQMLVMGAVTTRLGFAESTRPKSVVLVTNSEGNDITVIDLEKLTPAGDWAVGDHPHGIAVRQDGRVAYTTIESEHTLKSLDCATGKVLSTLALPGRPNQCAVTPDGKFVAVPIFDGDSVQIVDTTSMRIVKALPVKMPHNCLNAGNNQHMFVTSIRGNQVNMIDLKTLEYVAEIPVGGQPRPIAVDREEKTLYVALSLFHGFVIVDIPSRKVVHKVEFPALPPDLDLRPLLNTATHGLMLTPDGRELWAASVPTGNVYVYDVASGKVSSTIAVGKLPNWIAFSADGRYGCVTNTGSDDCSIIERSSRKEVARVKVGKAPKRLAALSIS
ncbi:MAG TPA: cytochrome D1 domain-containing protein [Candidatus Angelobacter sp.]|nr:cytochrome D1 domain-containing protein [Candidatus Angelobacter sp.]